MSSYMHVIIGDIGCRATLNDASTGAGDFATNADIEAEHAMLALLHREHPDTPEDQLKTYLLEVTQALDDLRQELTTETAT